MYPIPCLDLEEGCIIKETKVNRVKINFPSLNTMKINNIWSDNYIDCVYKKIMTTSIVAKIMIMIVLITIIINPNY